MRLDRRNNRNIFPCCRCRNRRNIFLFCIVALFLFYRSTWIKIDDVDVDSRQLELELEELAAVLHIGSHKTGTTTIQSLIYEYEKELNKDNYVIPCKMPGRFGGNDIKNLANFDIALRNTGVEYDDKHKKTWDTFLKFLNKASDQKKNIILSSEEFLNLYGTDIGRLSLALKPLFKKSS
jgi:hypothetical protein